MAQRGRIDRDEPAGIGKRTVPHEIGRHLWRDGMEHIEPALDALDRASRVLAFEQRDARRAIDADQPRFEVEVDAVAADIIHQRGDIIGHAEQHRAGIVKFNADLPEHARTRPAIARKIHRLLRCARAFDRHGRLGEERTAAFERADKIARIGREIIAVIGGDTVLAERFGKTRDRPPIELHPGGGDKRTVSDAAAIGEEHFIVLGREAGDGLADPVDPARHDRGHGVAGKFGAEHPCPHHRPAGLVIMKLGGVDDRDRDLAVALEQAGGGGDACAASAHDHHIIGARRARRRGQGQRHIAQPRSARARTAIAEKRPRHAIEHGAQLARIGIEHQPGRDRNMHESKPARLGSGADFGGGGLARLLIIGAGADERAETGGGRHLHIGKAKLGRNREIGGKCGESHVGVAPLGDVKGAARQSALSGIFK